MTTGNTTLLGLALPVEGELDGTWGDVVNESITSLVDSAVAGTTTLSANADVTLTTTALAANQARQAILLWTASNGATTRNITAPAQSKPYIVINAGTGSIVLRGAGPTTGITIVAGEKCLAAWNGSDFVRVATSVASGVTSVTGAGTVNGITLTGTVTSTGNLTLGGSLTGVNLATQVTGTLPVANGGTGVTSSTGTGNVVLSSSPTLVTPALGTPSSVTLTNGTGLPLATGVTGTLPVANGGTGLTSTPANGAIDIGNGSGFTRATLTAGSNVTITNGPGSITIASTGGSSTGVVTMPLAFISGKYYMQPGVINGTYGWTSPFGSPVIFYYPIFVASSITVDRLAATVFATGTSSFELAIYDTVAGQPSSRLATSGTLSGASTGIKTATISAALTPGIYWLAIGFSTNSITMNGINGMLSFVSGGDASLIGLYGTHYYSFSGSSMLPLPASAPTYTLYAGGDGPQTVPVVSFRVA